MKLTGNTILITGGTSGIGRALAEAFHRLGNKVIIAGRRQALLDTITAANSGMTGVALDVEDAKAIADFAAQIRKEFPALNVLINNAGISRTEDFNDAAFDTKTARSIVMTNIVGVLELTAALLPALKRQPHAIIMATTSNLAFVPRANYPTYCASKAFLHSWLQSLRAQLRGTSVEALELVPPYVQTELAGPDQLTDPRAMPLADYIAEVMAILGTPVEGGEIIVGRAMALRTAERANVYDETFAMLNP